MLRGGEHDCQQQIQPCPCAEATRTLLRRNVDPPGMKNSGGSWEAFSADTCTNFSTPISREMRANRLAPDSFTSKKEKFLQMETVVEVE